MLYTLENEFVKLTISAKGAEAHSILGKKEGTEFLWNGNPVFWQNRAPVLFPIVGRLVDGTYRIGDKEYKLGGHGFAKDMEFSVIKQSDSFIKFQLAADEETRAVYPFDFLLCISYELKNNAITVKYDVKNCGNEEMLFTIGAHPGFMCPLNKEEKFSDYYFEFSEAETADLLIVRPEGFFGHELKPFLKNEKTFDLSYDLFIPDALVFKNLKSDTVYLKSKNHNKHVKFEFPGFTYLGIWTRNNAPYVCIEPWMSLGDYYDFNGEFKDKPGMLTLKPSEEFSISHIITVVE